MIVPPLDAWDFLDVRLTCRLILLEEGKIGGDGDVRPFPAPDMYWSNRERPEGQDLNKIRYIEDRDTADEGICHGHFAWNGWEKREWYDTYKGTIYDPKLKA